MDKPITLYFVRRGTSVGGPYTANQLRGFCDDGRIKPDDDIREGEIGKWIPAERVRGLNVSDPSATSAPEVTVSTSEPGSDNQSRRNRAGFFRGLHQKALQSGRFRIAASIGVSVLLLASMAVFFWGPNGGQSPLTSKDLDPSESIFMVARELSCAFYLEDLGETVPTALTSRKLPYYIKKDPLDGLLAVTSRLGRLLEARSPHVRRCAISAFGSLLGVPPTVPKPDLDAQMKQFNSDLRDLELFPEYPQFDNPDGLTGDDTKALTNFLNNQISGAMSAALQMAAADEVIDVRWDSYTRAVDAVVLSLPVARGESTPAELAWWGKTKDAPFAPSVRISEEEPIRNALIVLKHYPKPDRGWKARGYWMPIRKTLFAVESIAPNSWVQLDSPALWETAWMECTVYAADGRVWTAELGMSPKSPEKSLHSACRSCVIIAKSTVPERRFRDQKTISDLLSFYIAKLESMGESVDEYDTTVERLHSTKANLLERFQTQMDTCRERPRWEGMWYPRAAGGQYQSEIPMGMEFYRDDECTVPDDPFEISSAPYAYARVYRPDDPTVVSIAKVFVELRETGLPLLRLRFTPSEDESDQDSYLAHARRENSGYLPATIDELFLQFIDEDNGIRQVQIRQDGREGIVLHEAN